MDADHPLQYAAAEGRSDALQSGVDDGDIELNHPQPRLIAVSVTGFESTEPLAGAIT
jgi:hypothetical protein